MIFEEPVPQLYRRAVASVVSRAPLPIAYGEHLFGAAEFGDALADGWPHIAQPDPSIAGGLTECLQIAAVAEAYGVPVMPHAAAGPLAMAAGLHLAAIRQNVQLLEHAFTLEPLWEVLVGPQLSCSAIVDGALGRAYGPGSRCRDRRGGAASPSLPAEVLRHVDAAALDRGDLAREGWRGGPWPKTVDNPRLSDRLVADDHQEDAGRLVTLDRPAVGDRPRVHDAVTRTELDGEPAGQLQAEATRPAGGGPRRPGARTRRRGPRPEWRRTRRPRGAGCRRSGGRGRRPSSADRSTGPAALRRPG